MTVPMELTEQIKKKFIDKSGKKYLSNEFNKKNIIIMMVFIRALKTHSSDINIKEF